MIKRFLILFFLGLFFTTTFISNVEAQCPTSTSKSTTPVTCFNGSDGTITVTFTGPKPPTGFALWTFDTALSFVISTPAVSNGGYTVTYSNLPVAPSGSVYLVSGNFPGCLPTSLKFVGPIDLLQPAAITSSPIITNVSGCYGNANGSITLNAAGGNGGFTYSFNGGAFGLISSFSGLSAATYPFSIKDNKGCQLDSNIVITQPTQLSISVSGTPVSPSCNGSSDGSITINATGGTPAYQYSKDNGVTYQSSNVFINLPAGTYTIKVKDNNNCTNSSPASLTVTLIDPPVLVTTFVSKTDVPGCFGDNTGQIVVNISGGTPGYTFSIDNGATFNPGVSGNNTINNLITGTYNIKVKDANNCLFTLNPSIVINQPPLLVPSLTSQINVDCKGNSTGSFTVTVTGGTPIYEYSLNGGFYLPLGNSFNYTNLTAGTYNVNVRDSKGCIKPLPTVNISEPAFPLTISSTNTDVTCNGNNDGVITTSVSGGTPGYLYSTNGGSYLAGSGVFSGLSPGNYDIKVKDANNCVAILPTVVINQPLVLTISLSSKVDVTGCAGNANGSISVSAGGGNSSYLFSINGGSFISTLSFPNLTAGNYTIVVKDAKNCTASLGPITITEPAALTASSSGITNASCNGKKDGSFTVTFSGGTASYTYTLNGVASGAAVSPLNITGIGAGSYSVILTDANNCTVTVPSVTITEPAALTASSSGINNASCNGKKDGSFTVTFSGGTASYTYTLNGVASGAAVSPLNITGIGAGSYSVILTDANNCTVTVPSVTITEPAALTASSSGINNASCNGKKDGSFTVTFSGGTASYTYTLNGVASGAAVSPLNITGIGAGSYSVILTDANNCTVTVPSVTITEPAALTASSSGINNASCNGKKDGSFTVTFSGGTASYTYTLNGVASGAAVSPLNITGIGAGSYSVILTDANNCTVTVPSVTITEPAALTSSSSGINNASCNGKKDGSFTVTFSGGTASYTYTLNGVASGAAVSPLNITGIGAGSYSVILTDANNCTVTVPSVTITEPAALTSSSSGINNASCNGKKDGSFTVTFSGGTASYTYTLNGVASGAAVSPLNITGIGAGSYSVILTDANNCTVTVPSVTITEPAALTSSSSGINNASCNGKKDGSFTVTFSGGTASYTYTLNGVASGAAVSPLNITGIGAGSYSVILTDANNCTVTVPSVTITEPAALTASSSGINNASCNGKKDGSFTVTFSGGTASYTYTLNGVASGAAVSIKYNGNRCRQLQCNINRCQQLYSYCSFCYNYRTCSINCKFFGDKQCELQRKERRKFYGYFQWRHRFLYIYIKRSCFGSCGQSFKYNGNRCRQLQGGHY